MSETQAKILGFVGWLLGFGLSLLTGAEAWQAFLAGGVFGVFLMLLNTQLEK